MTIAEASKKYDISADTLRYYERIGLIPPVPRTKSGIRDYDEASCGWIQLMKCMRKAGVQIEALIEYVALPAGRRNGPCQKSHFRGAERAVAYASGRDAGIFASVG